jgi:hypothetical protein
MRALHRLNQALISERGCALVKCLLVLSLSGLMAVAVADAARGGFGPAPTAPAVFAVQP